MFMQVKERLGGAGLVVAVVALIVALGGGAYAASATQSAKKPSKGLSKAQVIALIKANAKSGPVGATGPQGAQGAPGAKGDPGTPGIPGTNGKSAKVTAVSAPECKGLGGAVVEVAPEPKVEVCNGKEGSPWTAGGKLPAGSTETGAWAFNATEADTEVIAPISFPIQLAGELAEGNTHFQGQAEFATNCTGSATEPKAAPGNLCVYFFGSGKPENATFEFFSDPSSTNFGAGVAGAILHFSVSGSAHGFGSWAVTG